jgi:polyisoprenoid-binding protein YceI
MSLKTLSLGLALAMTLAAAPSLRAAETYKFDNAHTEIAFKISHWVINRVRGTFDSFDGSLVYDEKNPAKSTVEVSIDTASINTRIGMRDRHLKSPDFFDAEKFPKLTFKSTSVTVEADGKTLDVAGDLTMRDVTKSVVLKATITDSVVDNYGNSRRGFTATTQVNRMDYGIAWNKTNKTGTSMLGDLVDIEIAGEGIKK